MELGFVYLRVGVMFSELVWPENKIVVKIVVGSAKERQQTVLSSGKNVTLAAKKAKENKRQFFYFLFFGARNIHHSD